MVDATQLCKLYVSPPFCQGRLHVIETCVVSHSEFTRSHSVLVHRAAGAEDNVKDFR